MQKRQSTRAAIELRLNEEVVEARAKYNQAKLEYRDAALNAHSLGLDTVDGVHALHVATRHQKDATTAYSNAIGRLCDFMVRGTVPQDY